MSTYYDTVVKADLQRLFRNVVDGRVVPVVPLYKTTEQKRGPDGEMHTYFEITFTFGVAKKFLYSPWSEIGRASCRERV